MSKPMQCITNGIHVHQTPLKSNINFTYASGTVSIDMKSKRAEALVRTECVLATV